MRKFIMGATVVAAMALPGTALAHNADKTAAKAACTTEQTTIGDAAFVAKYGNGHTGVHHAFSRCVKQGRAAIATARMATATAACTAAAADPDFAAAHGGLTFAEFYRRGHDPMTRCVKETVKAAEKADKAKLEADLKAAAKAKVQAGDDDGPNHDLNDNDEHGGRDNDGPNHH